MKHYRKVRKHHEHHTHSARATPAISRINHTLTRITYDESIYGVQIDTMSKGEKMVEKCRMLGEAESHAPGMKYDSERAKNVGAYVKLRALGLNIAL